MPKIRRHGGGAVHDVDEYTDAASLLAIPWVAEWEKDREFHRFSVSNLYLMAEQREGRMWWVVGFMDTPVDGLPEWKHPAEERAAGEFIKRWLKSKEKLYGFELPGTLDLDELGFAVVAHLRERIGG